jgi:hypothetical protein
LGGNIDRDRDRAAAGCCEDAEKVGDVDAAADRLVQVAARLIWSAATSKKARRPCCTRSFSLTHRRAAVVMNETVPKQDSLASNVYPMPALSSLIRQHSQTT